MLIGMCAIASACNLTEQITCHRFVQSDSKDLRPVRTTYRNRFYTHYSSTYPNDTFGCVPPPQERGGYKCEQGILLPLRHFITP